MATTSEFDVILQLQALLQRTADNNEPLTITVSRGKNVIVLEETEIKRQIEDILEKMAQKHQARTVKKRVFGSAKGLIKMAYDFDAPLDDFKDYM